MPGEGRQGRGDVMGVGRGVVGGGEAMCESQRPHAELLCPPHATPRHLLHAEPHEPCYSACVGMAAVGGGGGEAVVRRIAKEG